MQSATQLGIFDLITPIATGGMGEVWRGRHRAQGTLSAIKLLKGGLDTAAQQYFEREVQAHAGLHHPGIVYLFDYGAVSADESARSNGRLAVDEPYLAMEFAGLGTLRDHMSNVHWHLVDMVIRAALDALAHAHARDVIHRDLKPENILFFEENGYLQPKLSDFGIAHALDSEKERPLASLETFSGTPFYMPPEQARGQWRDYGPWTDLYALGCIVWELVCGRPPYIGDTIFEIIQLHIGGDLPVWRPLFEVPEGLEDWLRIMLAPRPETRFLSAAQAFGALPKTQTTVPRVDELVATRSLGEPGATRLNWQLAGAATQLLDRIALESTVLARPARELEDAVTQQMDTQRGEASARATPARVDGRPTPARVDGRATPARVDGRATPARVDGRPTPAPLTPPALPDFPENWRSGSTYVPAMPLVDAGLGLFGLREIPYVDRDQARDRLWRALGEVIDTGGMSVVLLVGGSGSGKSSLAKWLATRARELGVADSLLATHAPSHTNARLDGLSGMCHRAFRTYGLSRAQLFERLQDKLGESDGREDKWARRVQLLTDWLQPPSEASGEFAQFGAPGEDRSHTRARAVSPHKLTGAPELYLLAKRVLDRLTQIQPMVLILDDLQWGPQTLETLKFLLKTPQNSPRCLMVATIREDILASDEQLAEQIAQLEATPKCTRLDLEPLAPQHHRELIGSAVQLDAALLERIARRTEGNPLFATQLLRHIIDRDQLKIGPGGFQLRDNADEFAPHDIAALWVERLDRLVASYEKAEQNRVRYALELAATLGRQVDTREWEEVCARAGVKLPAGLIGHLSTRALARQTRNGFEFSHILLVDTLLMQAENAGRWARWNHCCAQTLSEIGNLQDDAVAVRIGQYWLAAGEYQPGFELLFAAGKNIHAIGVVNQAIHIYQQCEHALDKLNAPACDPRRVELKIQQSHLFRVAGQLKQSAQLLEQVRRDCLSSLQSARIKANFYYTLGQSQYLRGEMHDALKALQKARELYARARHPRQSEVMRVIARLIAAQGQLARAVVLLKDACEIALARGTSAARIRYELGALLYRMKRDREAYELLALATHEFENNHDTMGILGVENLMGERARAAADYERAETHYLRFLSLLREVGRVFDETTAQCNLGQVALLRGDLPGAWRWFERGYASSQKLDYAFGQFVSACGLIAIAASTRDWEVFDEEWARLQQVYASIERVDHDVAQLLTLAGERAMQAGEPRRAREPLQLARAQWQKLKDFEACARIDALLD